MRALNSAASGMTAQQLKIDTIANNLANVNTTSFKKSRIAFQDLYYQQTRSAGMAGQGQASPSSIQVGNGVRAVSVDKVFTPGSYEATGEPLHMAIQGEGFFQIMDSEGQTLYTRDGNFRTNADGEIVTAEGHRLEPGFSLPPDTRSINIGGDGLVSVTAGDEFGVTEVGTLELARFGNPAGLEAVGQNSYRATASAGQPTVSTPGEEGTGNILQGHLEASNVDVAGELVAMILAQRSYETASKAITTADEMLSQANQLKR